MLFVLAKGASLSPPAGTVSATLLPRRPLWRRVAALTAGALGSPPSRRRSRGYLRPFPDVDAGRWQVSTAGGVQALWAHSGRELFCVAADEALLTVPVEPRATWSAGTATTLVAPDGQRFLMIVDGRPHRTLRLASKDTVHGTRRVTDRVSSSPSDNPVLAAAAAI